MNPIRIGSQYIGPGYATYIVAEISANHHQQYEDTGCEPHPVVGDAGEDIADRGILAASEFQEEDRLPDEEPEVEQQT